VQYEIESLLLTPDYDQSNKALQESVYFRKMAHCRALYAFFTKAASARQGPKDDDIVSEDFGFSARPLYGNDSAHLLARFNKDLFHLTYSRLERTPTTKPWPMDRLFPPVSERSQEFVAHILASRGPTLRDAERALWARLSAGQSLQAPLQQNTSNVAISKVAALKF
jgi:hypothetical protein